MFYFRINQVKIKNNREGRSFLLVGPSNAEVKFFSFVTTEETTLPDMDEFLHCDNEVRRRQIIQSATEKYVGFRKTVPIENVKDNHILSFGDTGYVLYRSKNIPQDFNWVFMAIESDRDVRKLGAEMRNVVHDKDFSVFANNLVMLLAGAANPHYLAAAAIGKFVTESLANNLRQNDDDLIGVLYMSLNRWEHYPHGERKRDDIPDLTNNMLIDYSIFGIEE
ncbi:MAG: hypothetical protein GF315_01680 [candidate division Zixibacteria bacterium]|nr:hypothetical protein [candidate division Zixibacteria bacterium]